MPNHVTNIVRLKWPLDVCKKFIEDRKWERLFDLNTIIPQPSNIFRWDLWEEEKNRCIEEWIHNRYDWSCDNRGTKWNTYDNYKEKYVWTLRDCYIVFNTARNTPKPCWERLVRMYKDSGIEIVIKYADEDIWRNCWIITIYKWKILLTDKSWDNKRARRIVNKSKRNQIDKYQIECTPIDKHNL